ncbi:hypothetical protein FTRO_0580020 [Fructobacillus tropaeoli]|uniref:Uncharacterized protein n=1 Tax=Fructobacillus tropaeoli TaxID=709323 RepID=A0A3F3HEF0_9LACO|nr:hypothetical protein FTRO_0580020 [Fructobacillus tropaeoli]
MIPIAFIDTKLYTIKEIREELDGISYPTFKKYYRDNKKFPKAENKSKTHPLYLGVRLQNYFK